MKLSTLIIVILSVALIFCGYLLAARLFPGMEIAFGNKPADNVIIAAKGPDALEITLPLPPSPSSKPSASPSAPVAPATAAPAAEQKQAPPQKSLRDVRDIKVYLYVTDW